MQPRVGTDNKYLLYHKTLLQQYMKISNYLGTAKMRIIFRKISLKKSSFVIEYSK